MRCHPIDALAVARAALPEPDLPVARLDGPERDVRLLVDHRESLVAKRTRIINRLRWHLHELDQAGNPKHGLWIDAVPTTPLKSTFLLLMASWPGWL